MNIPYTKNTLATGKTRQQGVALIMSLVILLILTILGIQGMQTSTFEEKMAGNFRDKQMAFEAAESALKAGEIWLNLQGNPPISDSTGSNGVWSFGNATIQTASFWSGVSFTSSNLTGLATQPQFVIEERGVQAGTGNNTSAEIGSNSKASFSGTVYAYRITARGTGGSNTAVVMLQSDYEKVF
jgi:type IV pilus assembly protein PilX